MKFNVNRNTNKYSNSNNGHFLTKVFAFYLIFLLNINYSQQSNSKL